MICFFFSVQQNIVDVVLPVNGVSAPDLLEDQNCLCFFYHQCHCAATALQMTGLLGVLASISLESK